MKTVLVPREVRLDVFRRFPSAPKAARDLEVSVQTAYALLEPGGAIRDDVLERVRERLRETAA